MNADDRRTDSRPIAGARAQSSQSAVKPGGIVRYAPVMRQASGRENPFRPGAGARPPVLAGRDPELALANSLLESLARGRAPSRGLLFFGPRGNGKTALLNRLAEGARRRGMRTESLPAAAFRNPEALRQELQENVGLTGTRLRGVTAAGFGVSTEPGPPTANAARLFAGWIGDGQPPLVILLDEAHTIEPEAGRLFFDAVQEATNRSLPFLLLAAGTPDTPRRLRKAGTFTERALQRVPVGRLARDETLRAFREPARDAGLPVRDDAAAFLAAESQDYPYFVQLFGSAAWDAAGDEIHLKAAHRGAASVQTEIERFYAERFDEARDRAVHRALAPLAALVTKHRGRITDAELDGFLAAASEAISETKLLNTLTDLGVLWKVPPAGWELGIPSFAAFVLEHHTGNSRPP